MSELGQIKAHLVAESSEWVQGLSDGAKALERFEKQNTAALKRIEREQKKAAAEAKANARERAADMAAIGQAAQNLAKTVTQFTGAIGASAAAADDLTDSLAGAFGDRADQMSRTIQKLGTGLQVFSDQAVAGAAKSLEKFGQATEQNLARVVDVAAKTGQSVEGIAEAFGKFEKFGDSKSILALQKAVGATGPELAAFGAKIDENNKVLADTPARAEAAKIAMQAFLDQSSGAAAAMADDSSRLTGSLELLKREIGESGHAMKESFAPYLLQAVESMRELSPETKAAAGAIFTLTGYTASAGGAALSMASNVSILTQNTTLMAGASKAAAGIQAAFATTLGASLGVIGLLAIALGAYIVKMDMATAAAEKNLAAEEKRANLVRGQKNSGILDPSGKVVSGKAKKASDLDPTIAELTDRLKQVQGDGSTVWNPKTFKYDKINDGGRDAINKARERLAAAKAERNRLAAEEAKEKTPAGDVNAPSAKEKKALDKDAAKVAKAAENTRKAELKAEIAAVNQGLAAKKIDASQAIESLEKIKSEHAKTAEERIAIDTRIAVLTGQIESKKTAEQKKEEAKRTADHAKAERERLAEIKRSEAERKREQAKALRDQAAATKQALKQDKTDSVQAAREKAAEVKAATAGMDTDTYTPFGATLSQFSGGPISGSIDDRRQATWSEEKDRIAKGMAGNTAQAASTGARITAGIAKIRALKTTPKTSRSWKSMSPSASISSGKDLSSDSGGIVAAAGSGMSAGEELKSALESAPIVINVSIAGKQVGTFKGSAGELSRQANVVNPNVPLGGA